MTDKQLLKRSLCRSDVLEAGVSNCRPFITSNYKINRDTDYFNAKRTKLNSEKRLVNTVEHMYSFDYKAFKKASK